jgi:hypothetical protein
MNEKIPNYWRSKIDEYDEEFTQELLKELNKIRIDIEKEINNSDTKIQTFVNQYTDREAEDLFKTIIEQKSKKIQNHHEYNADFYLLLKKRWQSAIELLEAFYLLSIETGSKFNEEFLKQALESNDYAFLTLRLLHGRACLVTGEIIILLKNGYPDGAVARWRTLYELSVTANFLKKHGNPTFIKYLEHQYIEYDFSAKTYQKYAKDLHQEPLTESELARNNKYKQSLIEKYGANFIQQYGWASDTLNEQKGRISFKRIAENSDFAKLYPYYQMASIAVHSNARGFAVVLGQPQNQEKVILVGPSDAGFADPGSLTAISLLQINVQFLSIAISESPSRLVALKSMLKLEREIQDKFLFAFNNPISE